MNMVSDIFIPPDCQSCDTFVYLPPATRNNAVIFGKNSDRPSGEVQEIVQYPANSYGGGTKLQCTYIEINQATETAAVILSKPSWMWGAEMGANEHGVCIGNEAVWTKMNSDDDLTERLLGMDLVRLGLERSKSAREAVDVITNLLGQYGQGGPCSDTDEGLVYHNSFLIADTKDAWVLETAGEFWAAEHITSGFRNISNMLSIGANIDLMSDGLKEKIGTLGLWKASAGEFNFSKVFRNEYERESSRFLAGRQLLKDLSKNDGTFDINSMMAILRNEESGICRSCSNAFPSTSSQVSVLSPQLSSHWFTGTPDPKFGVFKPFIFPSANLEQSNFDGASTPRTTKTTSPTFADDPAKVQPRFQKRVDRSHPLYKAHELCSQQTKEFASQDGQNILKEMKSLEDSLIQKFTTSNPDLLRQPGAALDNIFDKAVNLEISLYDKTFK